MIVQLLQVKGYKILAGELGSMNYELWTPEPNKNFAKPVCCL